ncbi:hypothetical protein ACFUT3_30320 [Streptomyces cinereoruber]|uniref:hypothetical protein n=1 Tax=Streptomyces cinereoruber TaxID=67260 RepID=UPI0036257BD0
MATIPATQTFLAGEKVTASKLTAATKTPLDFLFNPPRASVFITAGVPVSTGVTTLIPFDGESWDTDSMHSTTTNPSRVIINTPGQYLVSVFARFPVNATGYRQLTLRANAAGVATLGSAITAFTAPAVSGTSTFIGRTFELACNAGDYFELFAYHTAGTTLNLDFGTTTGMQFRWIGNL